MPACSRCPSGRYAESFGASACAACAAGHVSNAENTLCTPCASGTAPDATGAKCERCTGRTYAPLASSAACELCPMGHVANAGGTGCEACAAGTLLRAGATTCEACDVNTIAPGTASISCFSCPPGSVADPLRTVCEPCPAGTYRSNQTVCTPCETGFYAPSSGSTSCLPARASSLCLADELCPLATVQPIKLTAIFTSTTSDLFGQEPNSNPFEGISRSRQRRRLREIDLGIFGGSNAKATERESSTVQYGTLNATVTEPVIQDESIAVPFWTNEALI
eukprot:tig00001542_g9312.t1